MSKKSKRTRRKKQRLGNVQPLRARGSPGEPAQKLSEIIQEMARRLLKDPEAFPSFPVAQAALMLASAAWNCAVDGTEWSGLTPSVELRSSDTGRLIAELVEHKRDHYPNDLRRIAATELSPDGNVRVHWVEQDQAVTAAFGSTTSRTRNAVVKSVRPIAEKLIGKMKKKVRGKVIHLEEVKPGRANAEELQKSVAASEGLAGLHPAHAAYVYTKNQVSVMSEQLAVLNEMSRFVKIVEKAEDEYMPSGPPMSPLTNSFFTCWALFDVSVGLAEETIATTAMAVGDAFGMHPELLRLMESMQQSRMGIYAHEGCDGDAVVLRELVTGAVFRAIDPSGYRGRRGELWYVRVLPPPIPGTAEHVVFTTPYLLLEPGELDWQAYFRRTLPDAPLADRIARYERHMKFGPARDYWTEFVFEAYVNHRPDVIFLKGLPDVPESRPHSRVNRR